MSFNTHYRKVHGLGSAREGTQHWWLQRITSVAMIPLTILFVIQFGRTLGSDHSIVIEIYSNVWNALIAILFITVVLQHLKLGLQVVIEDYVHNKPVATTLLVLNTLLCWGFTFVGVYAIARISFGFLPI